MTGKIEFATPLPQKDPSKTGQRIQKYQKFIQKQWKIPERTGQVGTDKTKIKTKKIGGKKGLKKIKYTPYIHGTTQLNHKAVKKDSKSYCGGKETNNRILRTGIKE